MAVVNIRQAFVISKERQILPFLAALPYFHRILESITVGIADNKHLPQR